MSLQFGSLLCRLDHHGDGVFLARDRAVDRKAIQTRDYPLVQGCVLVIAVSLPLGKLLTDIFYHLVDPRITYVSKHCSTLVCYPDPARPSGRYWLRFWRPHDPTRQNLDNDLRTYSMENPLGLTSWAGTSEPSSLWRRISLLSGVPYRCDCLLPSVWRSARCRIFGGWADQLLMRLSISSWLFGILLAIGLHGCSRPGSGFTHSGPLFDRLDQLPRLVRGEILALRGARVLSKRQGRSGCTRPIMRGNPRFLC